MAPPRPAPRQFIPLAVNRAPYFCSGCPHSTSTKVPEGALIGAGIGCHSMVLMMEPERVGNIVGLTAMGNEGAQWFGMAPFVDDEHLIQNIGDGTLFHSGMGAIRAAVANGANITYKILYNGAVAMTGGQDPFGQLEVLPLVKMLLAAGVRQVIITTDDLSKYRMSDMVPGVKVWGRGRIIEAQEELSFVEGCTVLIHDQRCAAEKRRDRKRDRLATPDFRVVINERVCEGCGDCGDASNCLSVQPVDTPFGRKTRIDQDSCNFDRSCEQGDCPAFMHVRGDATEARGKAATTRAFPPAPIGHPAPTLSVNAEDCTIRLSGIGGTGVVTTSQILGTAAMLQGFHVRGLDQTGLSQKAGPVVSDLRLSLTGPHASNKATAGSVDVLLAFDQLAAGSDATIRTADAARTVLVANTAAVPTGSMVVHPDRPFPLGQVTDRLDAVARRALRVDAGRLVHGLLGDDSTVNVFMVGVAAQAGLLPIDAALIERAIELNGVAVAKNIAAFRWGRSWAIDATHVEEAAGVRPEVDERPTRERLSADLVGYQSAKYAAKYDAVVDRVAAAGHPELTDAVARHLHKLMAYKDEYEVARLLLLPESRAQARALGGRRARVQWMLHPPLLRSLGMKNKLHLGRWATPAMWTLRALRHLRGTPLDMFGWAAVRRVEREMVPEYIEAVDSLLAHLRAGHLDKDTVDKDTVDKDTVDEAVAIASLPDRVRGYEGLKLERAEAYRLELADRLAAFTA
jgi:indolepyruvate ferredoxin oxidoreductase